MLVDITAATDTLYDMVTSPAKLFAQGQRLCNRNFTDPGSQKRLPCLKSGISLGSALAILLFNIYTLDLIVHTTTAKKSAYL